MRGRRDELDGTGEYSALTKGSTVPRTGFADVTSRRAREWGSTNAGERAIRVNAAHVFRRCDDAREGAE